MGRGACGYSDIFVACSTGKDKRKQRYSQLFHHLIYLMHQRRDCKCYNLTKKNKWTIHRQKTKTKQMTMLWHVWLNGNKTGSDIFLVTHQCQGNLLLTQLGFYCGQREVKSERSGVRGRNWPYTSCGHAQWNGCNTAKPWGWCSRWSPADWAATPPASGNTYRDTKTNVVISFMIITQVTGFLPIKKLEILKTSGI